MDNYEAQNEMQKGEQLEKPLSFGEWLITMIVLAIPCVGVIMLLVWGFGNGNVSRRNYCRAALVMVAIAALLSLILWSTIAALLANALSGYYF